MKNKTIKTTPIKKDDNIIYHIDAIEAAKLNKPYIIPASKTSTYSKLDKVKKREERQLKKELQDYLKY